MARFRKSWKYNMYIVFMLYRMPIKIIEDRINSLKRAKKKCVSSHNKYKKYLQFTHLFHFSEDKPLTKSNKNPLIPYKT